MLRKSLFKNKNYYLLMGYQLSNGIADKLFQFCIPWFVYDLTDSAAQMTFTFGMTMIPYMLFSILGGAFIDCFNRRKLLLITSLLSGITLFFFSLFFSVNSLKIELGIIYLLSFLLSTYNAFDQPAFDSSIIEYFSKDDLVSINATLEVILSFCMIAGPLLAGFLVYLLESKETLFVIAFIYLISFSLIKISKPIQETSLNRKFTEIGELIYENCRLIKEGFLYLLNPGCPILLIIFMTFLNNILLSPKDTLIVFLARNKFNLDAKDFAFFISIISFVAILGIIILLPKIKKMDTFFILIAVLIIDSFASIFIGLSNALPLLFIFYLTTIITCSVYSIFARSLRQSIVPHPLAGRVASISKSLRYAGAGLGSIFSTIFLEFAQVETFFVLSGALMFFVVTIAYHLHKKFFALSPRN